MHDYCARYAPPPTLCVYAIHHTILVMAVLCKGRAARLTPAPPLHPPAKRELIASVIRTFGAVRPKQASSCIFQLIETSPLLYLSADWDEPPPVSPAVRLTRAPLLYLSADWDETPPVSPAVRLTRAPLLYLSADWDEPPPVSPAVRLTRAPLLYLSADWDEPPPVSVSDWDEPLPVSPAVRLTLGLYKTFFHLQAFVHESIIVLAHLHCPRHCNTIARLLRNIRPPSTLRLYAIDHTILVMAILCEGQTDTSPPPCIFQLIETSPLMYPLQSLPPFYCSGVSVSVWAAAGRLLWRGGGVRCFVGVNLSSSWLTPAPPCIFQLIETSVISAFGAELAKFHSSGREDVDVRIHPSIYLSI